MQNKKKQRMYKRLLHDLWGMCLDIWASSFIPLTFNGFLTQVRAKSHDNRHTHYPFLSFFLFYFQQRHVWESEFFGPSRELFLLHCFILSCFAFVVVAKGRRDYIMNDK